MMIHSNQAENTSILAAAQAMCLAARTAPKAKGMDCICTAILTGEEKEALARNGPHCPGTKHGLLPT